MSLPLTSRAILMAATVSMAATSLPFTAAQAQGYDQPPPPPPQYQQQYDQGPPPDDQGPPPPPGYDGRDPPPPPPGYDQSSAPPPPDQQASDARYARYAENWARYNCVQSHANVGAGVALGGLF